MNEADRRMKRVSIIVPVFHNAPSLPLMADELRALAARNPGESFEFIFVDDGSQDDSFAVLQGLAAEDTNIRVVKLSRNFGSNPAIVAGLSIARGDVAGIIAADLQDPPEKLDEMLALWRGGKQVVVAARADREDPVLTKLFASLFYRLFRRYALPKMPEKGFDFYLIDRRVINLITAIQENNVYLTGLILWFGFDPAVVHYKRRGRKAEHGRSRWTFTRKIKYFIDAFVAFSNFPVRAASVLGITLSGVGLAYAVLIIGMHLFSSIEVAGWSSLMVVLLIVSGVQLLMLGVIGEYIWRALDETRKRPRFIIDRVLDASPEGDA
jgi:glycosyltransferase involved in cell wall biosynthesis